MAFKQISQLLRKLRYKLQEIHAGMLYRWILPLKSHPITVSQKSAIVFSPHQDDETLGCGGTIAMKCQEQTPVAVVFLTNGQQGGEPEARRKEAENALKILGVPSDNIHFLDLPDGNLQYLPEKEKEGAIASIQHLLELYKPAEVYIPHRRDRHADHEASFALVQTAIIRTGIPVEIWQYPIWLLWKAALFIDLQLAEISAPQLLSIGAVLDKKQQAIAAYSSQCISLPTGFLNRFFLPYEIFFKSQF